MTITVQSVLSNEGISAYPPEYVVHHIFGVLCKITRYQILAVGGTML
jgi:hypothetical protein